MTQSLSRLSCRSPRIGFIVGVPRSGTTLVAAILNRHRSITVTPETHFFRIIYEDPSIAEALLDDLPTGLRQYFERLDAVRGDQHQLWAPDIAQILSLCKGDHRPQNVFTAMCKLLAEQKNTTSLILEKTPSHLLHADAIRRLFPEAPIVHVIRDGRDVATSLSRVYWATDNYFANLFSWTTRITTGAELLRDDNNTISIRYEDLLQCPTTTAERIIKFLGFEFTRQILYPDGSEGSLIESGSEHKDNITQRIDADNAYRWKKDLSQKRKIGAQIFAGKHLRKFGYECCAGTNEFLVSPGLIEKIIADEKAEEFFGYVYENLGECDFGGEAAITEASAIRPKAYFLGSLPDAHKEGSRSRLKLLWNLALLAGRLVRVRNSARLVWVLRDGRVWGGNWVYRRLADRIVALMAHEIVIMSLSEVDMRGLRRYLWLIPHVKTVSRI